MPSRFLLLGPWKTNTGPANVNNGFVKFCDDCMSYIHTSGLLSKLERLRLLFYPAVVISGGISDLELTLCKLFHKKMIYIMHGCSKYESEINNLGLPQVFFDREDKTLKEAHIIACVSSKYAKWVANRYPQYAHKITYINNGLNLAVRPIQIKEPYSIAISGGNRHQKKNEVVCKAVKELHKLGYNCKVYAFGREYPNNEDIFSYDFVHKMGHLDKEDYYSALDSISLYVINSIVESFGLVVGDALNCNCSLLMSEGVGAASIMETREEDIIKDCNNVDEVAAKIIHLLEHANSSRLYNSIDIEAVSEHKAYINLKRIVDEA